MFTYEFTKQPSEQYSLDISYAGGLPSGAALTSVSVAAIDFDAGTDATSAVLVSPTATLIGTTAARFRPKGGTSGKRYKITVLAQLSTGPNDVLEDDVLMCVVDD